MAAEQLLGSSAEHRAQRRVYVAELEIGAAHEYAQRSALTHRAEARLALAQRFQKLVHLPVGCRRSADLESESHDRGYTPLAVEPRLQADHEPAERPDPGEGHGLTGERAAYHQVLARHEPWELEGRAADDLRGADAEQADVPAAHTRVDPLRIEFEQRDGQGVQCGSDSRIRFPRTCPGQRIAARLPDPRKPSRQAEVLADGCILAQRISSVRPHSTACAAPEPAGPLEPRHSPAKQTGV